MARRDAGPSYRLLRLLDSSFRQHPGEVLRVLRAGARVAGRVEAVGCVLRRLLGLGALRERVLHRLGALRRRADIGQADPPVTVHLLGCGSDDGPVEQAAPELDVLVRPVGHREHDLGDYLVCRLLLAKKKSRRLALARSVPARTSMRLAAGWS